MNEEDSSHARLSARRVIVAGLLVVGTITGSAAYDVWRSYRETLNAADRELDTLAGLLSEQLSHAFREIDVALVGTGSAYLSTRRDPMPAQRVYEQLLRRVASLPQIQALDVADAQGRIVHSSRANPPPHLKVPPVATGAPHRSQTPSEPVFAAVPAEREASPSVVVSRAIDDENGHAQGRVIATVSKAYFEHTFGAAIRTGDRSIALTGADGSTLFRLASAPRPERPTDADADAAMSVAMPEPDRVDPLLVRRRTIADLPLEVTVSSPQRSILAAWRARTVNTALRAAAFALFGSLVIVLLVRELRRREAAVTLLRRSEERYALAMEASQEGHWDWDAGTRRLFVSARMKAMHGLDPGDEPADLLQFVERCDMTEEDQARFEAAATAHFKGQSTRFEIEYRCRVSTASPQWIHARGLCFRGANGRPVRFSGSAIDITERKLAEERTRRLETQLRQSQRLEAVGTLAGGIAHDFNNILAAIVGYGEMAREQLGGRAPVDGYLAQVLGAGQRGKDLVERLLTFSQGHRGSKSAVELTGIVNEVLALLRPSIAADVTVTTRLLTQERPVMGDATQLHQVIMNLCLNALQAMPNGGELLIDTELIEERTALDTSHGHVAPGSYMRMRVADTGIGIDPAALPRIFDPFYTTKDPTHGTGLGLSQVLGIVREAGGAVHVESVLGKGSRFTVLLPAVESLNQLESPGATAPASGRGETVLVVDDEPALAAMYSEILLHAGFRTESYTDGARALRALHETPREFAALMTDQKMPGTSGLELARSARVTCPNLPVVLISGRLVEADEALAEQLGIDRVLRKPLSSQEIVDAVAGAMASRGHARAA